MPDSNGSFSLLQRTCSLVVLLCFLHIFVTVVYYMRNSDSRPAFVQNQQHSPRIHRKLTEQSSSTTEDSRAVSNNTQNGRAQESCPEEPPRLVGPLRVEFSDPISLDLVRSENTVLQPGGRFKPSDCTARQKVAMIIPFRNRDEHLKYWLYYLHPILQRQQLDYGVYIINQRAKTSCSFSGDVSALPPPARCVNESSSDAAGRRSDLLLTCENATLCGLKG